VRHYQRQESPLLQRGKIIGSPPYFSRGARGVSSRHAGAHCRVPLQGSEPSKLGATPPGRILLTNYGHMLILCLHSEGSWTVARPHCCRKINDLPEIAYFKPRAVPLSQLEEVVLALDEFEAIRLADREGLYHDAAAERMGVSRQTFGRIIESARHKVAEFLAGGKALKIEGGTVTMPRQRTFKCDACQHEWQEPFGTGRPQACPSCHSDRIHRAESEMGGAGRMRSQRARCCRRTRE